MSHLQAILADRWFSADTHRTVQVGGQYAQSAYIQGSQLYSSGKKRGFEAWVAAHPHIRKALARSQVHNLALPCLPLPPE